MCVWLGACGESDDEGWGEDEPDDGQWWDDEGWDFGGDDAWEHQPPPDPDPDDDYPGDGDDTDSAGSFDRSRITLVMVGLLAQLTVYLMPFSPGRPGSRQVSGRGGSVHGAESPLR